MQNFDDWNINKKKINSEKDPPNFHIRGIWFCVFGLNIGREENGKNERFERPVLVLRKFAGGIFYALPLTTMHKELPYYYLLDYPETSSVLLSQARVLDARRLIRKIRTVSSQEFEDIKFKFKELI